MIKRANWSEVVRFQINRLNGYFGRLSWAVVVGFLATANLSAAAEQIDVSKLKPGDKLEYNQRGDEWVPAEFVGKGPTDSTVLVKRAPYRNPVSSSISKLRLPAGPTAKTETSGSTNSSAAKNSASSGGKNPLVEKELNSTSRPRIWSDRSRSFKIEAALLRVEDGKVILRRSDNNSELAVPLDKLSEADQKIVADSLADPKSQPGDGSKGNAKPVKAGVAITPTDYKLAPELKLAESDGWKYEPDSAADDLQARDMQIKLLPSIDFFESPARIMLLPKDKKAFVVMLDSPPGKDDWASRVQACDLETGKATGAAVFGVGVEPMEISPDGSLVLARSAGLLPEKHGEMRIYSREGNRVNPICAWKPYATAAEESADNNVKSRPGYETGVSWTALVDNQHAFTLNEIGELVLWQFPEVKPVCRIMLARLTHPVVSANRKYIVVPHASGLVILTSLDGKPVGTLTGNENKIRKAIGALQSLPDVAKAVSFLTNDVNNAAMALRDDGARLAIARGNRIRIWDLKTQELVRDFMVQGLNMLHVSPMDWTSDKHLLLQGKYLIDVEQRIPIWQFKKPADAYVARSGRVWLAETSADRRQTMLVGTALPDKAIAEAAAKINPNDLLLLRPGVEVAIDLQTGGTAEEIEETKHALEARLLENGMKVSPESKTRLVASIQPGKTQTIRYHTFGRSPLGGAEEYQVPTQLLSLSFQVDGETVWKEETQSSPPLSVMLKQGESIEQAVAREMGQRNQAIGVKAFSQIPLPTYLARMPKLENQK